MKTKAIIEIVYDDEDGKLSVDCSADPPIEEGTEVGVLASSHMAGFFGLCGATAIEQVSASDCPKCAWNTLNKLQMAADVSHHHGKEIREAATEAFCGKTPEETTH